MVKARLTKEKRTATRWQVMLWLLALIVAAVLTLVVWIMSNRVAAEQTTMTSIQQNTDLVTGFTPPLRIDELNELSDAVAPIKFDALVRDLRQYPDEFKDIQFLKQNKGKWTVQIMDVAENEVITDYLSNRKDRNQFAYFRYRDESNKPRYVLTYGILSSPQEALGAARTIDFKLPSNVRVFPEEINRYLDVVENYELAEPVQDMSTNRAREVNLQPTQREIPARPSEEALNSGEIVTTTDNLDSSDQQDEKATKEKKEPTSIEEVIDNSQRQSAERPASSEKKKPNNKPTNTIPEQQQPSPPVILDSRVEPPTPLPPSELAQPPSE